MCVLGALVQAGVAYAAEPAPVGMASYETYPAITLNGLDSSVLPSVRIEQGVPWLRRADLEQLGLRTAGLPFDQTGPDGRIALNAVPGLSWRFDAAEQRLHLTAQPARMQLIELGTPQRPAPPANADRGVVFNYDSNVSVPLVGGVNQWALWSELRAFDHDGYVSSTGVGNRSGRGASGVRGGYIRYDTWWSRADPAALTTWTVGDQISSATSWSRAVHLAASAGCAISVCNPN